MNTIIPPDSAVGSVMLLPAPKVAGLLPARTSTNSQNARQESAKRTAAAGQIAVCTDRLLASVPAARQDAVIDSLLMLFMSAQGLAEGCSHANDVIGSCETMIESLTGKPKDRLDTRKMVEEWDERLLAIINADAETILRHTKWGAR